MASGEPGICQSSITMLTALVDELKAKHRKLLVTLSFDEMAIRKNVTWSVGQKKFIGFINYGKFVSDEQLPLASNCIVFMVNGINEPFNLPVAHYFINNLDTMEKMFLVLTVIKALTDIGVSVAMVSFDGLATNITTMESLGACFELRDMKPYIKNPIDGNKIFIMLDPPHMIKLMRNYIGSCKQMIDSKRRSIEWKFYEHLELLRETNQFVTHKLTKSHINYVERKMKVSLAVQLLSQSVANSMKYLKESGHTNFEDCEGTIEFTLRLNNIFDIFNSRNGVDSGFKRPLCPQNKDNTFKYLDECKEYLEKLEISSGLLIESSKKTGVKGLIINIESLKMFYEEYVENRILPDIAVYSFNQDPLESFFGRIRSFPSLGCNDNPTVTQYNSAYRKNVVKTEITASVFGNCLDKLDILHIPSTTQNKNAVGIESRSSNDVELSDESGDYSELPDESVSEYMLSSKFDENATIAYIAVSVEKKVSHILHGDCVECANIFEENDKIETSAIPNQKNLPCVDTFNLCRTAYTKLEVECKKIDFNYPNLLKSIHRSITFSSIFCKSTHDHQRRKIVDLILENFIRIRATYIAKNITLQQQNNTLMSRMRKINHFTGR